MKYTLITGASSGIGKALCYQFAAQGHNLIITARRQEELANIKSDIEKRYRVRVQVKACDLAIPNAAELLYNQLQEYELETMINNAGFGDYAMPWEAQLSKTQRMIDVNISALTTLSLLYVADYAERHATLINVASIGGYSIFDIAVTYCATKFYVAAFTEGLAQTLADNHFAMRAKVIAPGPTQSDFITNAADTGAIAADGLFPEDSFISAQQLAEYTYQLYRSDKVIGVIEQKQLVLQDPVYPYITVPR
ncbi:SDR family NAD(P)-dependent oxidoreductase [Rheinheimera sp. NSM]|uniref:SDR family NAD(P)-dependent oxidoreductase n=1 Tax=Rheinheimera sp. NSM TaxID=3457884 RepID=UPI004036B189